MTSRGAGAEVQSRCCGSSEVIVQVFVQAGVAAQHLQRYKVVGGSEVVQSRCRAGAAEQVQEQVVQRCRCRGVGAEV